jgi:cytochrome c551/c552
MTIMKSYLLLAVAVLLFSCGGNQSTNSTEKKEVKQEVSRLIEPFAGKGIGKYSKVDVAATIDEKLAEAGHTLYTTKCIACHKLTGEKAIGPGWKDVTKRFKSEWIMNFITNTDEMLNKDEKAKELLKEANNVRMVVSPVLTEQEAKEVFEFMRKNDEVK